MYIYIYIYYMSFVMLHRRCDFELSKLFSYCGIKKGYELAANQNLHRSLLRSEVLRIQ